MQLLNAYSIQQDLFLNTHKMNLRTPISSECHFISVHNSNSFVSNLMSVHVISSYVDIASISKHFPIKKLLLNTFLHYLLFTYQFY